MCDGLGCFELVAERRQLISIYRVRRGVSAEQLTAELKQTRKVDRILVAGDDGWLYLYEADNIKAEGRHGSFAKLLATPEVAVGERVEFEGYSGTIRAVADSLDERVISEAWEWFVRNLVGGLAGSVGEGIR